MRTLALVDGEHYPPVTRWGIEVARERGYDVIAAVLVGGIEKLARDETPEFGVPVRSAGDDRFAAVAAAIDEPPPRGSPLSPRRWASCRPISSWIFLTSRSSGIGSGWPSLPSHSHAGSRT